jgi:hypothetical protein
MKLNPLLRAGSRCYLDIRPKHRQQGMLRPVPRDRACSLDIVQAISGAATARHGTFCVVENEGPRNGQSVNELQEKGGQQSPGYRVWQHP